MTDSAMVCGGGQRGVGAVVVKRVFLLLLAAIGVFVCVGTASASSRGEVGARIINGSSAPAGAWPSIAYLGFTLNSQPSSIAVDSAGNVFTANAAADTISRITPGTPNVVDLDWAETGLYSRPVAIVIDSNEAGITDDVIYAALPGSNAVSAFRSNGTEIWSKGIGTGPVALALDSVGNVYTANFITNTVTKITPGGDVTAFASTGAGSGPNAIAVDSAGNVYTANAVADTVTKITAAGTTTTVWASTGEEPVAIAIDSADNVYTANSHANTVTKITAAGTATTFAATGSEPSAIAVDSSNSVYTANYDANTVTKITSAGVVSTFAATGDGPVAIAINSTSGDVFTANRFGSTVTKITSGGTTTLSWEVLDYLNAACTGSVIAPRVILTAAHCTMDENGVSVIDGFAIPGVIDALDDASERGWDMDYLLPHPDYNPMTFVNDVALVVLASPTSAPAMPLIAPWQDGLVVGGAPATIAGWGRTVNGGGPSRFLQEATVPLISDANCARDLPVPFQPVFDPVSMLCAGDVPAGIDTCQGDSGGPLALTISGTRTLVGDTSWGPGECATGPGVYGRISAFRSWILNDTTTASGLVRSHLQAQNAAARGLALTSAGPNVTLTWGVSAANWTTTGFRVSINGAAETVTGPVTARTVAVPAGGVVSATVLPQVTLGTATAASISVKPTPTRAPVVSSTTPARPRVGARLRVTAASDDPWGGAVSYQWLANGVEISGATSAGYRPVAGQAGQWLSLRVAATNAVGTGTTTVVAGRVRQAPQVRTGSVAVTGEARVGGRLQARPSAVTGFPQPQASYRWFRDGRRVPGVAGAVYRVRPVDAGARITGRVTWTNAVGTVTRSLRPVTITG
jgi:secreted trypsin-like serine protease